MTLPSRFNFLNIIPEILLTSINVRGCAVLIVLFAGMISAQDLEPRAYVRIPVDMKFFSAGISYTAGGVLMDPTAPVQDLEAKVEAAVIGTGVSLDLFGLTSQVYAGIPYVWAQLRGKVLGEETSTNRAGLGDLRMRMALLLYGAPAVSREEFRNQKPSPLVLGSSLTIIAPTGQFFPGKLINVGTNRWSFKPEAAVSWNVTDKWAADFYAGVWFFTDNNSFYPGSSLRTQEPLYSFQGHLCYSFNPLVWAALDFTYYTGGQSSVNSRFNDDRQNNSRIGATVNIPVSRLSIIKVAFSSGAIIRIGANFSTVSASWQVAFF